MCTEERGGARATQCCKEHQGRRTQNRLIPSERDSRPLQQEPFQWMKSGLDGEITEGELTTEDKLLIPQVVNTIPFTV